MSIGSLSSADKARLKNLMDEGVQTMSDIATMKDGLKETVEGIAEELEIKKRVERSGLSRDVFGLLTPNGNPPTTAPTE